MVSPSMSTSARDDPVDVTTVPPRNENEHRRAPPYGCAAGRRSPGAGPGRTAHRFPDLFEQAHVQVADHNLLCGVGGGPAQDLPARVGEVGLAVEVVVAERARPRPG